MRIYIRNIDIQLTMPDASEHTFKLKAPNGQRSFYFDVERVIIRSSYRDAQKVSQRSICLYDVRFHYDYAHHNMNLMYLLVAEKIELKAPPNFTGTYETHEVLFIPDRVRKDWHSGLAAAEPSGITAPSGPASLEFKTKTPLTETELFNIKKWDEVPE